MEDIFEYTEATDGASATAKFYAFNTVVSVQVLDGSAAKKDVGDKGSEGAADRLNEGNRDRSDGDAAEQPDVGDLYLLSGSSVGSDAAERARLACRQVFEECRRYEKLLSRTLPQSDIGRLNAACGEVVSIAEDTYRLLEASIRYCALSEGAFDITVGAVTRLWDFQRGIAPDAAVLAEALSHVDYRFVELGGAKGERWARLADPQAAVDLGGTAKGYIADALCDVVEACGLRHFLINLGGNVVARGGKPDGAPFKVGIKNPQEPSAILGAVQLHSGSVVTSGLYERAFMVDGVRYSHILNPRTGMPVVTDVESVTVVAPRSLDCDGFSTTLCALGMERGREYACQRPELQTVAFVGADNKLIVA
ncbi:MAG: FAD:protein FMN transferase [Eggerthellaceae bacterium]|nr:FAD:protein FMN transferase [Eggerthellaceae bacterium]